MAKFNNRSEDKGRSKSRADKRPRKTAEEDKKSAGYKSKRSFTKNKSFRETTDTRSSDKPRRPFKSSDDARPFKRSGSDEKPSYREKSDSNRTDSDRPKRTYESRSEERPERKDFSKDKFGDKPRRAYKDSGDKKPFKREFDSDRKPFKRDVDSDRKPERAGRESSEERRPSRDEDSRPPRRSDSASEGKSYKKVIKRKEDKFSGFKKAGDKGGFKQSSDGPAKRRLTKPRRQDGEEPERRVKHDEFEEGRAFSKPSYKESGSKFPKKAPAAPKPNPDGLIRLNKYLSNAGVASRREADNLIISGVVKVNGVVINQLGAKVNPTDKVTFGDAAVRAERKVYLLLNKPKDYITTVEDPKERKTVMELIAGACRERVYPVGRLDRNTTGLLLFTNDGELTTKLTHPKFGVKKVYHVSLNKGLKAEDFKAITEGVELEDGVAKADDLAFVGEGKKEVGIEIHSGRNRIVRRIFEHLGYDVLKLDRVVFAGLTKKDLPRGKHRFLTGKEIGFLQMIG